MGVEETAWLGAGGVGQGVGEENKKDGGGSAVGCCKMDVKCLKGCRQNFFRGKPWSIILSLLEEGPGGLTV